MMQGSKPRVLCPSLSLSWEQTQVPEIVKGKSQRQPAAAAVNTCTQFGMVEGCKAGVVP
jgi:hypothetical protein